MTSDELDRELRDALHVDPPAGYAARIRTRVAVEPLGTAGNYAWWPAGVLAAGFAVFMAASVFLGRDDSAGSVPVAIARSAEAVPGMAVTPARPDAGGGQPAVERREASGRLARDTATRDTVLQRAQAEPAVIIAAADAAGLRLLMTMTETTAPPATDEREGPVTLQLGRIDVMPIELDSLPRPALITLGELQ